MLFRSLLNARVQLDVEPAILGTSVSIAAFGRNLAKQKYNLFATEAGGGVYYRGAPREFGVELKAAF